MRIIGAALSALICLAMAPVLERAATPAAHDKAALKQEREREKPGARPGAETCRYAQDNECDEPIIGTGACPQHTDYSDCRYLRYGERDACEFANDGECDEPHFGTGACPMGSDRTDCGDVSALRFQDDSCDTAFNGICEEPSAGRNECAPRTDRSDCIGRDRPTLIGDHFFGHDDRMLMDTSAYPWRAIGEITLGDSGKCTATLVARDVIITAAHCITTEDGVSARGEFKAGASAPGGPFHAQITGYFISPRFNRRQFDTSRDVDGLDWALLRIDAPLGDTLGFVSVADALSPLQPAALQALKLAQAGYSWDTGVHLSGSTDCSPISHFANNTFSHTCDTTHGDSGSPFLLEVDGAYKLVGVDSRFQSAPDNGPYVYIGVSAAAFARYVDDFAAGRIEAGQAARMKGP